MTVDKAKGKGYHPTPTVSLWPRLLTPFVFAVLLSSCNPETVRLYDTTPPPGKHRGCDTCHASADPQPGSPVFADAEDPASLCLRCHAYTQNHHPVDFVPAESSRLAAVSGFPLLRGKVTCVTCHDPHGVGLTETPSLLRGGPYPDRRDPCFRCHHRETYAAIDVHAMVDGSGRIRLVNEKPVCLLCHAVVPNPLTERTLDVTFRADVAFLCWRCHPPMPGEFFSYHFLIKPSPRITRNIRQAESEMNVIFPLVPRDRITCSTCHNPHQKEVLVHEPARTGADSRMRLRMQSPAICVACHPVK